MADQLQSAYQQGLEHGAQAQQAQQADEIHRHQAAQLSALEASNAEKEAALAGRIEELKNRDYRPPLQPMQCKDEREAVLARCQVNRGATAGDLVFACQPNVVEPGEVRQPAARGGDSQNRAWQPAVVRGGGAAAAYPASPLNKLFFKPSLPGHRPCTPHAAATPQLGLGTKQPCTRS